MVSQKNSIAHMILGLLILAVALSCSCKRERKKTGESDSPFYPYYSTENTLFSISHEIDAGFSDNNLFVQTYYESDEYSEARREQCVPKIDDDEEREYLFLPIDEKGNVITPENQLLILNCNGETVKKYNLNQECGSSSTFRRMVLTESGCWVMSRLINAYSGEQKYCLDYFTAEDGVVKHIDLAIDPERIPVTDFVICDDGRIAILCWQQSMTLILVDSDGNSKEEIALPETAESTVVFYQGKWTCIGRGKEGETILFQYDEKNVIWTKKNIQSPVRRNILVRGNSLLGIGTADLVYMDSDYSSMIKWEDVSVWGEIHDIKMSDKGEIDLIARPLSENTLVLYHLIPVDKHIPKEEYVIAGYDLENSCLKQLIQEMSLRHPEIKFVLRDYKNEVKSSEENWGQVKKEINTIMSLDIANGTAPDMYYDFYDDNGLEDLGRLGYLMDLSSVTSKLDENEFYVEKITMGEEKPYCICLFFDVIGFCASDKYVENPYTWTYEDFYQSAKKYTDLSCIQSIFSKSYLLKHAIMAQIDTFVQDGSADFTGDDFIQLLKWTNDIGCRNNWDDYVKPDLDNGFYMLDWADVISLSSVIMYQDHIIVGFPNESGSLHMVPYSVLAVSATTSQPDLSCEIIQYALGEPFQSENYQIQGGIPVNRKYDKIRMEKEYELYSQMDPDALKYSKQEYFDMYFEIISRADRYLHSNQAIVDICLEEAEAYYAGDSSAEHVAGLIQNRVTTYLRETNQ